MFGDVCGELSFFFGMRQTGNARTPQSSPATCFVLPREDYMQLIELYPGTYTLLAQGFRVYVHF